MENFSLTANTSLSCGREDTEKWVLKDLDDFLTQGW